MLTGYTFDIQYIKRLGYKYYLVDGCVLRSNTIFAVTIGSWCVREVLFFFKQYNSIYSIIGK